MIDINKHIIEKNKTVREALIKLNELSSDLSLTLFVINEKSQICGTITDGDIRRGLVNKLSLEDPIEKFMNNKFHFLKQNNYTIEQLDSIREKNIKIIPILDENNKIIKLFNLEKQKSILPVDGVIMAGGRGKRLSPLTDKTPKPLLPVGDKPIIQYNIERLIDFGLWNIFVTVNYLGEQIEQWINSKNNYHEIIKIIKETEPLGTIGSVSLIRDMFIHNTILIINSDLLTNINYEEFYRNFINEHSDMAIATIPYTVNVPYAVLETKNSHVSSFKEKPSYTYQANAGIYLIKKFLLDLIPGQKHLNATDFMQLLISKGYRVTTFPIFNYWLDIGKPEDYEKANKDIKNIRF